MDKNRIIKAYGNDYLSMTKEILCAADLEKDILVETGKDRKEIRIGIKPNLVCPSPAMYGATTHPELAEGLIQYLQSHGFENISILEGSWVGDSTEEAFEYCGYRALEEKYHVPLIDTKKLPSSEVDCMGLKIRICNTVSELDYLINLPVLKGHCQTKMTCALKNMKGLIPDSEKRRFHQLGLHTPIAHLNTGIHQNFILVDDICPDPDFEEGGNPQLKNCIFAAKDPVLVDALACRELDIDVREVPYVTLAEALGVGKLDGEKTEIIYGSEIDNGKTKEHYRRILDVSYAVEDTDTCSACYASLTEALWKLKEEGLLKEFSEKIGIGQGMKGKNGKFGIGNCARCFETFVPGCPPDPEAVYKCVKNYIENIGMEKRNE